MCVPSSSIRWLSIKLLLSSLLKGSLSINTCVNQLESCTQDYDCCGFGIQPGIVCQKRDCKLGPRCYTYRNSGELCNDNSQCRSQQCVNGTCKSEVHREIGKYVSHECVKQLESCVRDYDCCGIGTEPGIVCQTRNYALGPKCYTFRKHGEPCTENSQCRSQQCTRGTCQPNLHLIRNIPDLCPITYPTDDLTAVVGELTSEEGTCPCQDPDVYPEGAKPENVLQAGDYINNYPINAGFLVRPSYGYPLRKLSICTSDRDAAYDPLCYKIEVRYKGDEEFNIFQEGTLELPRERKTCIRVHIEDRNEKARPEYDQFKVTFPCQRGGFEKCDQSVGLLSNQECQNYPVIVDQIALLGNCRDRNVCKVKSRVFYDIVGDFWMPPAGACPNCMKTINYPVGNGPGKTVDDTAVAYINYKAKGSGVVFEGIETSIHIMRLYPAECSTASDPVSYEVYGSTDKQHFELMGSGSVTFPKERNTSGLVNYVEVEWDNEIRYEVIKVVFPMVEGSFDTVCSGSETCKDYPLVIGGIELYGWC